MVFLAMFFGVFLTHNIENTHFYKCSVHKIEESCVMAEKYDAFYKEHNRMPQPGELK